MEEKEAPTPIEKPNNSKKDIMFRYENKINFENKIYVIKIEK